MKTRNNVMILDTETVGTFGSPLIHDIGYVIINKDFEVLKKGRFLVKELHQMGRWILNTSDFYNEYSDEYVKARKTETIARWADIAKTLKKEIRDFKVTTISAYNIAFDYRAIKYTDDLLGSGELSKVLDQKGKSLLCIWNLACETILQSPQFHQFAVENDYVSERGNISTSAETCYRFIKKNTEYIEKHTALSDAEDEKEILEYIITHVKGKKSLEYGLQYNAWRKAQK